MNTAKYRYFERDLSWLAFNYRVLQEAKDKTSPLYERIKFLAIYNNNLEEFYKVRVAEHRSILTIDSTETQSEQVEKARQVLDRIHQEVTRQLTEFTEIFGEILPELESHNIILCDHNNFNKEHQNYIEQYFNEEVLPYLQPMMIKENEINSFLRDNRVYISVRMYKRKDVEKLRPKYAAIKLPYSKISRFIQLPETEEKHYIVFLDDIIKLNLKTIFPGYNIDRAFAIRVSRDADLMIEDELDGDLVNKIKHSLSRRKTGSPSRFLHEKGMPSEMVKKIRHAFNIHKTDVVEGGHYLAMEDLFSFPNPFSPKLEIKKQNTVTAKAFETKKSLFKVVEKQDVLLQYPYHSYDYLIRFLMEASYDPYVEEIMVTQYRVASNSAVVNSLISAAQKGKKVTVFVELKARFDEELNLHFAFLMRDAGIKIIYSIPNLKVHAKIALVLRKNEQKKCPSFAYLSTGNFNEKTARSYSDFGLFTSNNDIVDDLKEIFFHLNDRDYTPQFSKILVARFNLVPEMKRLIDNEIARAKAGKKARITIKMNSIEDPVMINKLYEASQAGVKIDMIIRGICCLIPGEKFSKNITIIRIVDSYLEHARIWHFYADGKDLVFMGSPDWMRRNLYRRIETVFPILNSSIKQQVLDYLQLELRDNVKGTFINNQLQDVKKDIPQKPVRSQYAMFDYWEKQNTIKLKKNEREIFTRLFK